MNITATQNATTVVKEKVSFLAFPKSDVLLSESKRMDRESRIKKAMRLGNSFKGKVKIIFEDMKGLKKVETTVWGFTDKNLILKKTVIIPIRCIHEILFY